MSHNTSRLQRFRQKRNQFKKQVDENVEEILRRILGRIQSKDEQNELFNSEVYGSLLKKFDKYKAIDNGNSKVFELLMKVLCNLIVDNEDVCLDVHSKIDVFSLDALSRISKCGNRYVQRLYCTFFYAGVQLSSNVSEDVLECPFEVCQLLSKMLYKEKNVDKTTEYVMKLMLVFIQRTGYDLYECCLKEGDVELLVNLFDVIERNVKDLEKEKIGEVSIKIMHYFCGKEEIDKPLSGKENEVIFVASKILSDISVKKSLQDFLVRQGILGLVKYFLENDRRQYFPKMIANVIAMCANVCCENKKVQDQIREGNIIPLILKNTTVDDIDKNPFKREWCVFCLNNLTKNNLKNQQYIAEFGKNRKIQMENKKS